MTLHVICKPSFQVYIILIFYLFHSELKKDLRGCYFKSDYVNYLCKRCSSVLDSDSAIIGDGCPNGNSFAGDVTSTI